MDSEGVNWLLAEQESGSNMSTASSHRLLLGETHEKIQQLEQAIAQINAVRKALKENSIEVKSQISTVFGRHLECMRSRELWLQSQVSHVEHAKDHVLRTQQDRLCQLLGALSTALAYSQDTNNVQLDTKLAESIRLAEQELKPAESSSILFRGNLTELRSVIRSFGRVESRSLPLEHAFVAAETEIESETTLPRTYEDYGEPDHHILYKTVEDIQRGTGGKGQITVSCLPPRISKESTRPWLTHSTPTTDSNTLHPRLEARVSNPDSECSVEHWLQDIKQHVELEDEEDFEIINRSTHNIYAGYDSESMEMINVPAALPVPEFALFAHVRQTPASDWLLRQPSQDKNAPVQDMHDDGLNQEHVSQDAADLPVNLSLEAWREWVQRKETKNSALCQTLCSTASSPVDIEDMGQLAVCPKEYVHSTNTTWLLKPAQKHTEKDIDEKEMLESVCRANEMCDSLSACLCDARCTTEPSQVAAQSPDMSSDTGIASSRSSDWLLKTSDTSTVSEPPCNIFTGALHDTNKNWLIAGSNENEDVEMDVASGVSSCQQSVQGRKDQVPSTLWLKPLHEDVTRDTSTPAMVAATLQHMTSIQQSSSAEWLCSSSKGHRSLSRTADVGSSSHKWLLNQQLDLENQMNELTTKEIWLQGTSQCDVNTDNMETDGEAGHTDMKRVCDGVMDGWLLKKGMCTEEEDDSQWLQRKESTPSSPDTPHKYDVTEHKHDVTEHKHDVTPQTWLHSPTKMQVAKWLLNNSNMSEQGC